MLARPCRLFEAISTTKTTTYRTYSYRNTVLEFNLFASTDSMGGIRKFDKPALITFFLHFQESAKIDKMPAYEQFPTRSNGLSNSSLTCNFFNLVSTCTSVIGFCQLH